MLEDNKWGVEFLYYSVYMRKKISGRQTLENTNTSDVREKKSLANVLPLYLTARRGLGVQNINARIIILRNH